MMSQNQYEAALALNALSNFVTPDLARDLANDLLTLVSSSRPYVRKKAVLAMYKIFLRCARAGIKKFGVVSVQHFTIAFCIGRGFKNTIGSLS